MSVRAGAREEVNEEEEERSRLYWRMNEEKEACPVWEEREKSPLDTVTGASFKQFYGELRLKQQQQVTDFLMSGTKLVSSTVCFIWTNVWHCAPPLDKIETFF